MLFIAVFSGLLAVLLVAAVWVHQHRDSRGRHAALVPVRINARREGPRPQPRHVA